MSRYTKLYIPLFLVLLLAYTAKINWSDGQWEDVLEADARGYYAYLPAIFIYDDINFGFFEEVEIENAYDPNLIYDYRAIHKGSYVNKYYVGEAVLTLPFFQLGHIIARWLDQPTDGYSKVYMIAITIAALFYLAIGLIMIKKTFELLKINSLNTFITISAILFGTNLFYYSIDEVGMSHVYSFSMISCFIYQMIHYFKHFQSKRILYGSLFLGIIILIRPINGIVLFSIPFLSQNLDNLKVGLLKYIKTPSIIAFSLVITLVIISIQLLIYKAQTGGLFVYSYMEEGFNFSSPQIINFLISYKKGFFLYTPICLVSLFGLYFLRKNKFQFITISLFLLLTIYILSSWWMWFYGGSFSSRVMIEYLPYFAILLGLLLGGVKKLWVRITYIGLIFVLTLVNQIQTLQYRYYIIHWSEMNKEKYWDTFLDISTILNGKTEEPTINN